MDQQTHRLRPNYKQIYWDILNIKQPSKKNDCAKILFKKRLSALDILELNKLIFEKENVNSKYRSYSKLDIIEILTYQKTYKLSNVELANHFKISRNTISKWKRSFL